MFATTKSPIGLLTRMALLSPLAAFGLAAGAQAAATPPPPNFIVIYGEGSGWTSSSAQMDDRNPASKGTRVATPSLERLAKSGMTFSDGYAPSPRCTPSRAGLITGRSPAALHMTFVSNGTEDGPIGTKLIPPKIVLELPAEETKVNPSVPASPTSMA